MGNPERTDVALHKVRNLVGYLAEFVALRSKTTRRIEEYGRQGGDILWMGDFPQDPACYSIASGGPDENDADLWMRVRQQKLPSRPPLPPLLAPWIDATELDRTNEENLPELDLSATTTGPADGAGPGARTRYALEDRPDIQASWDRYLVDWKAWATDYRAREAVQAVYRTLFALHQKLEQSGESVELVLGLGLLRWKRSTGDIRRHILVCRVDLKFVVARGELQVRHPELGARPVLEDDMMEPDDRPSAARRQEMQPLIEELGEDPWNVDLLKTLFTMWVGSLDAGGHCSMDLGREAALGAAPAIDFAPALILRPRGASAMQQVYRTIQESLSAEVPVVPFGLRRLVEDSHDEHLGGGVNLDHAPHSRGATTNVETIYFPNPSNPEQRDIVEKLRRRHGVLVQGPPGTGKSYTIGNLICHLLAEGQRILVTSESAKALQVLHRYVPEELRPLCVMNLGGDEESLKNLDGCVNNIVGRLDGFESGTYQDHIDRLGIMLDQSNRELARLDRETRLRRERETANVSLAANIYQGSPLVLAQRVVKEASNLSWCRVKATAAQQPPLTDAEFIELIEGGRRFSEELIAELKLNLPAVYELASPDELLASVIERTQSEAEADEVSEWIASDYCAPFLQLTAEQLQDASLILSAWAPRWLEWSQHTAPWGATMLHDQLAGSAAQWEALSEHLAALLAIAQDAHGEVSLSHVEFPGDHSTQKLEHDALQMVTHLEQGGKWGVLGFALGRTAEYFYLKECRINGAPARDIASLKALARIAGAHWRLDKAQSLWEAVHPCAPGTFSQRMAHLQRVQALLQTGFLIAAEMQAASAGLVAWSLPPLSLDAEANARLEYALEVARVERRRASADLAFRRRFAVLADVPEPAHSLVAELIGSSMAGDADAWKLLCDKVGELHRQKSEWRRFEELLARLREADADLAASIPSRWEDET